MEEKQKVVSDGPGLAWELGELGAPGRGVFAVTGEINTEHEA